jgi:hypothetical protein
MARSSNILAKNSGSLRRSMKGGGGGLDRRHDTPPRRYCRWSRWEQAYPGSTGISRMYCKAVLYCSLLYLPREGGISIPRKLAQATCGKLGFEARIPCSRCWPTLNIARTCASGSDSWARVATMIPFISPVLFPPLPSMGARRGTTQKQPTRQRREHGNLEAQKQPAPRGEKRARRGETKNAEPHKKENPVQKIK